MNYYQLLCVKTNANQEEIKEAYKIMIKKYHPDFNLDDLTMAQEKTSCINEAYHILIDNEKRKEYDKKINLNNQKKFHLFKKCVASCKNKDSGEKIKKDLKNKIKKQDSFEKQQKNDNLNKEKKSQKQQLKEKKQLTDLQTSNRNIIIVVTLISILILLFIIL